MLHKPILFLLFSDFFFFIILCNGFDILLVLRSFKEECCYSDIILVFVLFAYHSRFESEYNP